MTIELENLLINDFKDLNYIKSSCEDGWLSLIEDCLQEIHKYLKTYNLDLNNYKIVEIKNDFGLLKIDLENTNEDINEILLKYEQLSLETCEKCSSTIDIGTMYSTDFKTYCKKCATKLNLTKWKQN